MNLGKANLIWNTILLPKQSFVMWLALHGRLLTKAKLVHLNIHVEEPTCCLYQNATLETSKHLFVDYEYTQAVKPELILWSGVILPATELKGILELIGKKHWKRFHKQVVAVLCSAKVYHICKARNWKQFKYVQISHTDTFGHINKEIVHRIEQFQHKRKVVRYRFFWQKLREC